jgi:hypothetical protein
LSTTSKLFLVERERLRMSPRNLVIRSNSVDIIIYDRLSEILETLDSNEWRHVQELASRHTLQRDIIAALPLELVANILSFMEVADVFQYRRVSSSKALRLLWVSLLKIRRFRKPGIINCPLR